MPKLMFECHAVRGDGEKLYRLVIDGAAFLDLELARADLLRMKAALREATI